MNEKILGDDNKVLKRTWEDSDLGKVKGERSKSYYNPVFFYLA